MLRKLLCALVAVILCTGGFYANSESAEGDVKSPVAFVAVYYFHGNFRCPTCRKLEQYSKEAIESSFREELSSGRIKFMAVNVEEKDNEHFSNDYQLYTKSLVLSLVKDGKEIKHKNLAKIWEYVSHRQRFFEYVKSEVQGFLKEL